jgi:hypothetical protein
MSELSHIDPRSAALLVMDYQVDTLTKFMTAAQSADPSCRWQSGEGRSAWTRYRSLRGMT